jgi:hypothetical protein
MNGVCVSTKARRRVSLYTYSLFLCLINLCTGEALTEAELMAICHAPPDRPVREGGFILQRNGKTKRNKGFTNVFNGSPLPQYRVSLTTPSHDDRDGKCGSAEQSFPDVAWPASSESSAAEQVG